MFMLCLHAFVRFVSNLFALAYHSMELMLHINRERERERERESRVWSYTVIYCLQRGFRVMFC